MLLNKTYPMGDHGLVDTETFGRKVARYRERAGLKQAELARRLRVSPAYVSYIERDFNPAAKGNKLHVGLDIVDRISKVLNAPVNELRVAAGHAPLPEPGRDPEETSMRDLLLWMFSDIPRECQLDVLASLTGIHQRRSLSRKIHERHEARSETRQQLSEKGGEELPRAPMPWKDADSLPNEEINKQAQKKRGKEKPRQKKRKVG